MGNPVAVLIISGVILGTPACRKNAPEQARPNLLLIMIDTLRADHLSCYCHHRETSPCIDSFAGENIIFNNHYCSIPFTPGSHWSTLHRPLPPQFR